MAADAEALNKVRKKPLKIFSSQRPESPAGNCSAGGGKFKKQRHHAEKVEIGVVDGKVQEDSPSAA